jgi:hypothetical protein
MADDLCIGWVAEMRPSWMWDDRDGTKGMHGGSLVWQGGMLVFGWQKLCEGLGPGRWQQQWWILVMGSGGGWVMGRIANFGGGLWLWWVDVVGMECWQF